jgi:hypothetical protein
MVWLKRVWIACLLAIAGGGPLPLWLHHWQCHCDHSACATHSLACSADAPAHCKNESSCKNVTSCKTAAGCKHPSHAAHASSAGCVQASCVQGNCAQASAVDLCGSSSDCAANPRTRNVQQWNSSGSSHDDCAACYFLSQSTISQLDETPLLPAVHVSLRGLSPDQLPEFDLLAAYSSRAPPVL